jgi:DNA (cytosine-5)-methyltransferase 1
MSENKQRPKRQGSNKLNFIDVFSGAGGLSCGLEMAGMRCLLGVDHNRQAMDTFDHNHKEAQIYSGDIHELTQSKLEELVGHQTIHAVVGGPPCQGFSTVGLGNPNDQRNTLFQQFVRMVKITRPYFIVMENVTGLVAKKNEKTLKSIFRRFHNLGYNLDVQVMSAHHYGVPEKRRRTIIIGTRINETPLFPKITHDTIMAKTHRPAKTVGDALNNLTTKNKEIFNHDLDTASLKCKLDEKRLKRVPEGRGIRYEKDELEFLSPSLRLGIEWDKIPENRFRQTKYMRLDRSTPGPTIMTHRHSYYHPVENRYLTAREAAAIQSFPNDFIFKGSLSAQWKQIGNAVPPLLGKAIGQSLVKMHKDSELETTPSTKRKKPNPKKIGSIREKAFVYQERKQKEK